MTLHGFLSEMKKKEGRADLLDRENDPRLPGVRFVAAGGQYKVRVNMMVRGWDAWFVYAGTRQNEEMMPDELTLAERARERTEVGTSEPR